jgi:hypothetical protein
LENIMARKAKPVVVKVTKAKKPANVSSVKSLDPKDPDTKYVGVEPEFTLQPENRTVALMKSLSWYSRFYGRKDAKEILIQYLTHVGKTPEAKIMHKIDDNELIPSICWLARMNMRGLELIPTEQATLDNEITRLLKAVHKPELQRSMTGKQPKVAVAKPNVQEIMKEKTRECGGDLEGLFDDYILAGAGNKHTLKPIDEVNKRNILPQHISILTEVWKNKLNEFEEVLKGKDKALVEGYSNYSKVQLKNIIKFIEQVISDLNSYVSIKKATKAPRARKPVPVEKQVSKLKYMRTYKDAGSKLELVSISPTKLQGASEAWVYDTAKRKLHHYIADEYSKTFTIKGNTLIGFCTKESEVKTLRKPSEQIKEVMGSKPAARKFFKDIKAVSVAPNGRFNESMVILKAF